MIRSLMSMPMHRLLPWGIFLVSGGALAVAMFVEFGLGYEACPLCRDQQIIHGITAAVGLAALAAPETGPARKALIGLGGLLFLTGAVVAFYQTGLQEHWWKDAVETCGGSIPDTLDLNNLQAALSKPEKGCDVVEWTIFGLSAAAHNAVLSFVTGAATLVGLLRLYRAPDA